MIVNTKYGALSGVQENGCMVYKGIPYAQPPVGALRWKAPQPPLPWQGVYAADRFSGRCPQRPREPGSFYDKEFSGAEENATPLTEDCLYLNVWTPNNAQGRRLPVAVYIHGGAFLTGCGHEKPFHGGVYTAKDVILVTINYRLGAYGFLAHPWLSAENEHGVSGNYGILDQIAALRWVQENIAAFGGDPDNVTVMGQSAGAMSVLVLSVCELAKGLFARAVIQSGLGIDTTGTLAQAEDFGVAFAKNAGAASLEALRALPTEAIDRAAGPLIMQGFMPGGKMVYLPLIDGYVLKGELKDLWKSGRAHAIPCLVGSNRNDMQTDPERLAAGIKGPMYDGVEEYARILTATQKEKVYAYYFTRSLPGDGAGAFHSAELWYTFGNLDACWRPMTPQDHTLAGRMTDYWTNFIKTGDPNGGLLPLWEAATPEDAHILVLDVL